MAVISAAQLAANALSHWHPLRRRIFRISPVADRAAQSPLACAPATPAGDVAPLASDWCAGLANEQLNTLVAQALANNPSLKVARPDWRGARQPINRAADLPQVTGQLMPCASATPLTVRVPAAAGSVVNWHCA
jgi:outer membrane protein TolC